MTCFTESMPINAISEVWSIELWNPKSAPHVYKVIVAVDMLGNILWLCVVCSVWKGLGLFGFTWGASPGEGKNGAKVETAEVGGMSTLRWETL